MKKWITYCILSFFSLSTNIVYAEQNSSNLMGGYSIEGIPNEHQIDKNVSYFYLDEQPEEKDQIKVKLINDSSSEKTLEVKVTNANTNLNGLVDYTGTLKDHDSLKTPLTSIVKPQENEVKVAPKSEVETTLDLQMPSEKQEGIILGGVVVSEKQDKNNNNKNVAVGNTYSYTLGVLLTNDKEVKMNQNKSVELEKVGAILSDGRKVVQADILNPNPYIFGEATVSGKIMDEQETETIQETKKENVKLAPQSVYPFQFDWEKEDLKPGNYVFEGKVKTEDNEWNFKKKFTITDTEAKKINEESVFKIHIPKWLQYSAVISSTVTVIGTIWLFISRGRKENE
ncbi:DUF916 and DUF3324 domain-containing protein [Enterococcus faecium]|nr:DUF916 and DUF3324 domain-containing protein [Enterococcus faecium]MDQ8481286.1 DUF916 and DUF3324 domain-containing protein [Enterococcus faecium]